MVTAQIPRGGRSKYPSPTQFNNLNNLSIFSSVLSFCANAPYLIHKCTLMQMHLISLEYMYVFTVLSLYIYTHIYSCTYTYISYLFYIFIYIIYVCTYMIYIYRGTLTQISPLGSTNRNKLLFDTCTGESLTLRFLYHHPNDLLQIYPFQSWIVLFQYKHTTLIKDKLMPGSDKI